MLRLTHTHTTHTQPKENYFYNGKEFFDTTLIKEILVEIFSIAEENVAAHSVRDRQCEEAGGIYCHFGKRLFSMYNEQEDRSA